MPEVEIKDRTNAGRGKLSLSEKVFGMGGRDALLHEAVVNYLANQRQGTHAAKTKGPVRGGGQKPFKQKHTGKARAGSIRSPLWKGGGKVFGPMPRDYSYYMPRGQRRQALACALSRKLKDGELTVVEGLKFDAPKTKEMLGVLKGLGLEGKSLLIVLGARDDTVLRSARNIPRVDVLPASDINVYAVLSHESLLLTKDAVERLEARG